MSSSVSRSHLWICQIIDSSCVFDPLQGNIQIDYKGKSSSFPEFVKDTKSSLCLSSNTVKSHQFVFIEQ